MFSNAVLLALCPCPKVAWIRRQILLTDKDYLRDSSHKNWCDHIRSCFRLFLSALLVSAASVPMHLYSCLPVAVLICNHSKSAFKNFSVSEWAACPP